MPIGQLERAAQSGRGELYPQSLLGRQVYWTALGEFDQGEQALLDEYGDLEPRRGSPQITPLVRLGGALHGAPGCAGVKQRLAAGSLPIASVEWSIGDVALRTTAFARAGQVVTEHRLANHGAATQAAALVLAVRPVQINPYWQHGGHANVSAIAIDGARLSVNDRIFAAFSREPDAAAIVDFDDGDVVKLIDAAPRRTAQRLRSASGLVSAACEFAFSLAPGASAAVVVSTPMRDGVEPRATSPSRRRATASAAPGGRSSVRGGLSSAIARSATRSKRRPPTSWSTRRASPSSRARATTTAPGSATAPRKRSPCCGRG